MQLCHQGSVLGRKAAAVMRCCSAAVCAAAAKTVARVLLQGGLFWRRAAVHVQLQLHSEGLCIAAARDRSSICV